MPVDRCRGREVDAHERRERQCAPQPDEQRLPPDRAASAAPIATSARSEATGHPSAISSTILHAAVGMRSASRTQYPDRPGRPMSTFWAPGPLSRSTTIHATGTANAPAPSNATDRRDDRSPAPRRRRSHRRQGEQQPFALRGRRRREEEPREHERRTGALHEPDAETEKPERSERGDDGVGVARLRRSRSGAWIRSTRARSPRRRPACTTTRRSPRPPPERDQRDRRLDVGERRIEASDRPGGERFEAGQQDGILLYAAFRTPGRRRWAPRRPLPRTARAPWAPTSPRCPRRRVPWRHRGGGSESRAPRGAQGRRA